MTMTDEHTDLYDGEPETPPEPSAERAPAGSILSTLYQRQEELAEAVPELILDVPAYDGALVVRYRYPAGGSALIARTATKAQSKDRDAQILASMDAIRECCDAVLGRNAAGQLVDLATDEPADADGVYPKFDRALATLLRIDVPDTVKNTGRYIVREVFSPRAKATGVYDGDGAIFAQGGELLQWLTDTTSNIGEQLSGK